MFINYRKYKKKVFLFFCFLNFQSIIALSNEITQQELDSFVHRYLNSSFGVIDISKSSSVSRTIIRCNIHYCFSTIENIKVNRNTAEAIVRSQLREHLDLFDYLTEIRTSSEFLPYLEKYQDLKMQLIKKDLSPGIKIILVGDEHLYPYWSHEGPAVAICDSLTGMVWINANNWNNCIKHDPLLAEFMIFHELAHCDLNRDHGDNDNPLSFMDETLTVSLLHNLITRPMDSCRLMDPDNIIESGGFDRGDIEQNLEQLYTEAFSKDKFYNDNEYNCEFCEEDSVNFTAIVSKEILHLKQKLQQLAQEQL